MGVEPIEEVWLLRLCAPARLSIQTLLKSTRPRPKRRPQAGRRSSLAPGSRSRIGQRQAPASPPCVVFGLPIVKLLPGARADLGGSHLSWYQASWLPFGLPPPQLYMQITDPDPSSCAANRFSTPPVPASLCPCHLALVGLWRGPEIKLAVEVLRCKCLLSSSGAFL
jgi:hypothetical protein